MGFKGFSCPVCPSLQLNREQALEHLPVAHGGIVPAAVVEAIWQHEESHRRDGNHISPSMAGGCMRERVLERTKDQWLDPLRSWKMLEGSFWHEVMAKYNPPGWLSEVELPKAMIDPSGESMGEGFRCLNGVYEYELFPGLWFSLAIDSLRADYRKLIDYKTKDAPFWTKDKATGKPICYTGNYPLNYEYQLQLNLYGLMVKRLYGLDQLPEMEIWSLFKGIKDSAKAWKLEVVAPIDETDVEAAVRPNYELFLTSMRQVHYQGDAAIAKMPLQGLTMYQDAKFPGINKCTAYCGQADECGRIAGGGLEL